MVQTRYLFIALFLGDFAVPFPPGSGSTLAAVGSVKKNSLIFIWKFGGERDNISVVESHKTNV